MKRLFCPRFRPVALVLAACLFATAVAEAKGTFRNPVREGADPWILQHGREYYWCFSEDSRRIVVHRSPRLSALGPPETVWTAPATGPHSRQLWAPELHFLDGRFYVYVAASDGDNANHRMIVLESTAGPLGPYAFKAELYTGDDIAGRTQNRWAIDATVMTWRGQRYLLWSGWPREADEQYLYIARLANPWTVATARVALCRNDDFLWERVDETPGSRGLNEAPQVLQHGGRTYIVYSASASWRATYKLGLLELKEGADPLAPDAWTKHPTPVFAASDETFGVGHNTFVRSPDGSQWWHAYHAKVERADGWKRRIHLQPLTWTASGWPEFGRPVAAGVELALPAGEVALELN